MKFMQIFSYRLSKFDDKIIKNNYKKLKIFLNVKNDLFIGKTNTKNNPIYQQKQNK